MVLQAMRLFSGGPDWIAYNHPHDHLPARYAKFLVPSLTYPFDMHHKFVSDCSKLSDGLIYYFNTLFFMYNILWFSYNFILSF